MHKDKLEELLKKHHNKTAIPEEEILLQDWTEEVDQRSQHEQIFSTAEEEKQLGLKIWNQVKPEVPTKHRKIGYLLRYAAVTAGISLISWFLLHSNNKIDLSTAQHAAAWDTVTATPRTIKQLILKDGSLVYLNASSSVRYPKTADAHKREIELLYGEARFTVAHDVKRPFTVHFRGTKTRVLGTQFTVSGYATLPDIKVSVYSGKVAVSNQQKMLAQLIKGEALVYDPIKKTATRSTAEEGLFDPVKQSYYLKNASFKELALRIQNTYGYELNTTKQSIQNSHFTGELNFKEPITVTMHHFSRIYGGRFTIKGKEIQMY